MISVLTWLIPTLMVLILVLLFIYLATNSTVASICMALSVIALAVFTAVHYSIIKNTPYEYSYIAFDEIYKGEKSDIYYIKSESDLYKIETSDVGIGKDNVIVKKSQPKLNRVVYEITVKDKDEIKDFDKLE